ncbi:alpha/beta fold hydrolase [Pantoea sp. 18069]|uniref:alpha/beta fold hydrolase n=1 Tax=Pantoea sp. 18069 TaxID=2681415 RepID=UPI001357681E|nr:alpha/beta fold hydrolase [Pantoea sp. 18069]
MNTSSFQPGHAAKVAGDLTGRVRLPGSGINRPPLPLVVALHGGTYTSRYFDVPGASLLDCAAANGIPVVALDRPGYGASPALPAGQSTVKGQATYLLKALEDCWQRYGEGTRGIFLIGHSIGGAIAASIAAQAASASPAFPLLGLALSGMCLKTPPEHKPLWESLPDTPTVEMPGPVKVQMMFGPAGSYHPAIVEASQAADAPAPKAELVDIVSTWTANAPATLAAIRVPVHYRQSAQDPLWIMGAAEVDGFARALENSPRVDAAMVQQTGHCMDFHHYGHSLQLQQLAFALQCACEAA